MGPVTVPQELQLRAVPLALAGVLAATAVPLALRAPHPWYVELIPSLSDLAGNIALYFALGLSLWRHGLGRVTSAAGLGAALIEALQTAYVERHSSPIDAAANAAGALAGVLCGRHLASSGWRPERLRVSRPAAGIALAAAAVLFSIWLLPRQARDLSNWNPHFPVLVGNEATGDRPWVGAIRELAIVPASLTAREIRGVGHEGVNTLAGTPHALIAQDELRLTGGAGLPWPWPAERIRTVLDEVRRSGRLSIVVRCQPANARQTGPARIITQSLNTGERNVTLGQWGPQLVFRLRTTLTDPNGVYPEIATPPLLGEGRQVVVAATYDGEVARVYVDGTLRAWTSIGALGCAFPPVCGTVLPLHAALFGALLAVGALGSIRPRSPAALWTASVLVATAGAILVASTAVGAEAPEFRPWVGPTAAAGALAVAFAARWQGRTGPRCAGRA